jgi:tetratricopeptide (TPR) repeat protein
VDEGLETEVALCRAVWDGDNWQVNQDACSEVIARTKSDRLKGEALNYRGLIYSRTNRLDQALADFNEAIRILPSPSGAYNNRANVYRKQGKYDLMLADLEAAKVATPGNPVTYNNHSWTLSTEGDYAAALPLAEKALALGADDTETHDTHAHALMGLGRVEEAETAFAKAMVAGKSKKVRQYQQALTAKGYAPGRSDGVLDDATQAALRACIRDNCRLLLG